MVDFPDDFLLGLATSAHQVEGNNVNSDWWAFEHDPASGCPEPSGDGCDQLHRYRDDIRLFADLGFNAYRFSVEWARIEPEPDRFSTAALDHYRRVAAACRESGLVPVVTFNHFTLPRWLAARGGWTSEEASERFARYCERTARHLRGLIGAACTINEINLALLVHFDGAESPLRRGGGPGGATQVLPYPFCDPWRSRDVLLRAHRLGADAIRAAADVPVGLTLLMHQFDSLPGGEARSRAMQATVEDEFLEQARGDDFVGVQNYGRKLVGPEGVVQPPGELDAMGTAQHPDAVGAAIRHAVAVSGRPVIVSEHGTCVEDERRLEFLGVALTTLGRCLEDGLPLRGYLYWSALDNFEWRLGYGPKFGLIAVDRATQRRIPRASAAWLGEVARRIGRSRRPWDLRRSPGG